jgi:hypothetical protein
VYEKLLVQLAKTILEQALGFGQWETRSSKHYEKPKRGMFLEGLKVGDTVWWVDEDNYCEVCQAQVVCVKDGAGYFVLDKSDYLDKFQPQLAMVGQGYYKTREEALAEGRNDIEFELRDSLKAVERVKRLKALLAEMDK